MTLRGLTRMGFLLTQQLIGSFRKANHLRFLFLPLALLVCWPLISFLHEAVVAATAVGLRWLLHSGAILWLVERADIDRVYVSVAIQMAGNIQAQGLSIVDPLGGILHRLLPSLFAAPDLVSEKAWFSAIFQAGSSLLSRTVVNVLAAGIFISLGFILIFRAPTGPNRLPRLREMTVRDAAAFLIGLMLQLRGIWTILALPLTVQDLEAMGLPEFLTKVTGWNQTDYRAFIASIDPRILSLTPVVLLLDIYAFGFLIVALADHVVSIAREGIARLRKDQTDGMSRGKDILPPSEDVRYGVFAYRYLASICLVLFISVAGIPMAKTNYGYGLASINGETIDATAAQASDTTSELISGPSQPMPSVVKVVGSNFQYEYVVNGKRQTIRGVGYNAQFRDLSPEKRIEAYSRDFRAMKKAGVNTVLGWDQSSFDTLMLTVADQNGIGVVLPYHLPPDANYADPTVSQKLKGDILAWVMQYKGHPALRMWGIGNEVLHDMRLKDQRKAFADFYRDVADSVHLVDPDHPVIYREAEDVFVPILKKALSTDNAPRPWLIYGMNIFTYRLKNVLVDWRKQGIDAPLVVSEFAPTGLQPRDRPAGYIKMWGMMRDHPSMVVGGFMYVWTTAGPEPLDRVYGLVDERGNPTDGSLEAMSAQFLNEASVADQ